MRIGAGFKPLLIILLLTLVAGCTEPQAGVSEDGGTPIVLNTDNPAPTSPERDTDAPSDTTGTTHAASELKANAAGLTVDDKENVSQLVVGFYNGTSDINDTSRQAVLDSAQKLCYYDQNVSPIRVEQLEQGGTLTDDGVRRMNYAAEIANEFGADVPPEPLGEVGDSAQNIAKYAPLVASYRQMSDAACEFQNDPTDDEALEAYQISVVMFGVDAMLVHTNAFYGPAFAGTRFTANTASQVGLYRLRYLCGDRCWALAMSEVHVSIRGTMLTATSVIARKSADISTNLTREDIEALAEAYDEDADRLLKEADVRIKQGRLESVTDEVVECGRKVYEDAQSEEIGSDVVGGITDRVDKGNIEDAIRDEKERIETDGVLARGADQIDTTTGAVKECND